MSAPEGLKITAPALFESVLTPEALAFLVELHRHFNPRRLQLLQRRVKVQADLDAGWLPEFLPGTRDIRLRTWRVAEAPPDLRDRRVEITGPVDRKMVINALNSGAKVYMADFEDSHAPTWEATLNGQINLRDAVRRTISFTSPEGKAYKLDSKPATLMVRPRGWHLDEKHVLVDGKPISGSLFDFGLFFFHNAVELTQRESGPYFYLPKLENHLEARLWNDVFIFSQNWVKLKQGTIRATVLIETILAAFEMEEILFELRSHSAGLNCGRWDYIFSYIKKFRNHPAFLVPDRAQVTMEKPFLKAYYELLIQTCHRRGAHAMGGMAAQIPIKENAELNAQAMARVRADKEREVKAGHDGTWVAHPGLVPLAREIFDTLMKGPNQLENLREDVRVEGPELVAVPSGTITEAGIRGNIRVGVQYLEAWLRGSGCVPLYHLMEDAATAEISRAQLWQWIHSPLAKLEDGRKVSAEWVRSLLKEELAHIQKNLGEIQYRASRFDLATELFVQITVSDHFEDFLTTVAYQHID